MKFNKKLFWRTLGLLSIVLAFTDAGACGNWESQASTIIGLLSPALQALVAILAAFGVGVSQSVVTTFNNWAQQTQTALVTIKGLIAQYQTAASTAQPGILSEIQTALGVVTSQLSTILPEIHITDPNSQAKVEAALSAVSAFIASLITLIPAVSSATSVEAEHDLAAKANETAKKFRSDFNGAVRYFGKQFEI